MIAVAINLVGHHALCFGAIGSGLDGQCPAEFLDRKNPVTLRPVGLHPGAAEKRTSVADRKRKPDGGGLPPPGAGPREEMANALESA